MKRTIEITYGNSAKINRGNYEQEAPLYSAKSILNVTGEFDERAEYQRLRGIVDTLLEEHVKKAKLDLSGLRIRLKDNKKYPSVSSIMSPDQFPIDPEYGARGTEIHRLCNHFIKTGQWLTPEKELKNLKYEDIRYKEFFDAYSHRIDFSGFRLNIEVFNDKRLYSGELDLECLLDGHETLADFKTGSWKWMQLVAYYKCNPVHKQLAIFDLKNCKIEILNLTEKKDLQKAQDEWEGFLIKRGECAARFGV